LGGQRGEVFFERQPGGRKFAASAQAFPQGGRAKGREKVPTISKKRGRKGSQDVFQKEERGKKRGRGKKRALLLIGIHRITPPGEKVWVVVARVGKKKEGKTHLKLVARSGFRANERSKGRKGPRGTMIEKGPCF